MSNFTKVHEEALFLPPRTSRKKTLKAGAIDLFEEIKKQFESEFCPDELVRAKTPADTVLKSPDPCSSAMENKSCRLGNCFLHPCQSTEELRFWMHAATHQQPETVYVPIGSSTGNSLAIGYAKHKQKKIRVKGKRRFTYDNRKSLLRPLGNCHTIDSGTVMTNSEFLNSHAKPLTKLMLEFE